MGNVQVLTDVEIAVRNERRRQDEQWGGAENDASNSLSDWTRLILRQLDLASKIPVNDSPEPYEELRVRLVKVAALANATVEALDRYVGRPQHREGDSV